MDCNEARRALSAMADEELAPEKIGPLEEHVGGCAECAHMARTIDEVRAWFQGLPRPTAPAGLTARVLARLHAPAGRLIPLLRMVTAAAAVLLLATSAGIALFPKRTTSEPSSILAREAALDTVKLPFDAAEWAASKAGLNWQTGIDDTIEQYKRETLPEPTTAEGRVARSTGYWAGIGLSTFAGGGALTGAGRFAMAARATKV